MDLEVEAIRAEVEKIQKSRVFETSDIQRRLLGYLAEKSMSGEADRLKEYTVALDALGKPPSYDPRRDSSVRLQVVRLRQRLLEYYVKEGTGDPTIVTLPKGAFKLEFAPAEQRLHPLAPALSGILGTRRFLLGLLVAVAVLTLWATVATVEWIRLRRDTGVVEQAWNPDLERIWAPFLSSSRPVLVCLGTPLFARFPAFGFFRDPLSNRWEELAKSPRFGAVNRGLDGAQSMPWYSFTGAGEATGAFLVGKLLATRRQDLLMTRSNLLSWREISDSELVFVGPPKFNLQLDGIPIRQEFVIEPQGIRNLHPRAGEPAFLEDQFLPGPQFEGVTHALISHTPGVPGHGGHLFILAGNGGADTLAAAQWLTEPWRASELARRLSLPSGVLPQYYQVVLRVQFKNGIPIRSDYLSHRVLETR